MSGLRAISVFASVALLAAGVPAAAQDMPSAAARADLQKAAKCALSMATDKIANFLQSAPGSSVESQRYDRVRQTLAHCGAGPAMTADIVATRGALAEASYRRDFPKGALAQEAHSHRAEPVPAAWQVPGGGDSAVETLHRVARCAVILKPEEAAMLIEAAPGSAEEDRLFGVLRPAMARCVGANSEFTANEATMRGVFAEEMNVYWAARTQGYRFVSLAQAGN